MLHLSVPLTKLNKPNSPIFSLHITCFGPLTVSAVLCWDLELRKPRTSHSGHSVLDPASSALSRDWLPFICWSSSL